MDTDGPPTPTPAATPARAADLHADDTLASLLKNDSVPMALLEERYGPLLALVKVLIGVVPNCDAYLGIWPPAFRTYNVMVPNFLDLPFSIFGVGASPRDVLGLGMYVASRAAECPYCSAHTCSFALRRGVSAEKVARALVGGAATFTPRELATIAVARSLARIPCELTSAERTELRAQVSAKEAELIVLGIVMMGFLNKFMDAVGVELEESTFAEVKATMGTEWSPAKAGTDLHLDARPTASPLPDSFWTKLRIVPLLPRALKLDGQWQRGVPNSWPAVGAFLRDLTGHDFPVLARLRGKRAIRAIATMLRENLDPKTSVLGMKVKILAGVIFATVIEDLTLAADVRALGSKNIVSGEEMDAAMQFAQDRDGEVTPPGADPQTRAALRLARAASPSPARIDPTIVGECRKSALSAAAIVELITWLSVLQMLHRLSSYFAEPGV